jgi:hypothetical protein
MIKLPILHHTEETGKMLDLGMRPELDECPIVDIYFFNINAVAKYVEKGVEYTEVFSNGEMFICDLTIDEVLKLLK